MNRLASTPAALSALDARVEDPGGLSAFALLYLGYAYLYFDLPMAGGP